MIYLVSMPLIYTIVNFFKSERKDNKSIKEYKELLDRINEHFKELEEKD